MLHEYIELGYLPAAGVAVAPERKRPIINEAG
jgi:hypothetical protein